MDSKVEKYLESKNESIRRHYKRSFELFSQYTEEERDEEISGSELLRMVAEDRRKDIEDREQPEIELLKGFYNWLVEEAPKKRGSGKGFSEKSARLYLSGIIGFLSFSGIPIERKRLGLRKPTPKKENRKRTMRPKDVRKLVNHANSNRDKAIIVCLWQSGMGISELLSLDVGDVEPDDEEVSGSLDNPPLLIELERGKTDNEYRTCFGADACGYLKQYLDERERTKGEFSHSDPLFIKGRRKDENEEYSRLTQSSVAMMFRRLAKKTGLVSDERLKKADMNPARPHSLRAGFSSVLKREGVNKTVVNGLMGHSVPYDSTYHDLTAEELRELYQKNEDSLSIEKSSVPKKNEIEEVVKKQFGEMGAERLMPEIEKKLEESEIVEELKEENMELRDEIKELKEIIGDQYEFARRFDEYQNYLLELDEIMNDIKDLKKAMMIALPEEAFDKIVENFDEVIEEIRDGKKEIKEKTAESSE